MNYATNKYSPTLKNKQKTNVFNDQNQSIINEFVLSCPFNQILSEIWVKHFYMFLKIVDTSFVNSQYFFLVETRLGKMNEKCISEIKFGCGKLSSFLLSKMYIRQSFPVRPFSRCTEFNSLKMNNCFQTDHLDFHESSSRRYFSWCLSGSTLGLVRTDVILENELKAWCLF